MGGHLVTGKWEYFFKCKLLWHVQEEALQRRSEDEEKRNEITSHFQEMLNEIRAQIEQHSARNDKLCRENANLTDKLENMMSQCDRREEVRSGVRREELKMTEVPKC